MRFLTRRDGRNIDNDSGPAYEQHLDAIRGDLPAELYEMLRFPAAAYESGRTFYDAITIEWRESLAPDGWRHVTAAAILTPRLDRLYEFSFFGPVTKGLSSGIGARVGALYAVEVSRPTNESFVFCFLFMTRIEIEIECDRFEFRASETGRA